MIQQVLINGAPEHPLGRTLLAAGMRGGVVVLGGPETLPSDRLEALLLDDRLRIGAVVPRLLTLGGQLIEAGANANADGVLVSRSDVGEPIGGNRWLSADDVDGTRFGLVAVRSGIVAMAGIDPSEDSSEALVAAILAEARRRNLRIVYEPTWVESVVPDGLPVAAPLPGLRPRHRTEGQRILVVVGFVPNAALRPRDRANDQLISSIARNSPAVPITVLALDGFDAGSRTQQLRACGIEVVTGPIDLGAWFEGRWAAYSHAFLTSSGLESSVYFWISRTQPQALRVLTYESLPLRGIEALRQATPPDEIEGLEHVRSASETTVAHLAGWADASWCEREDDVHLISGLLPHHQADLIPPDLHTCSGGRSYAERSGLVVLVPDGYDARSGNEDSALVALRTVWPILRRRDPGVTISLLADHLTPLLAAEATASDAEVRPLSEAGEAISAARVLLALHPFGTGGPWVVAEALRSRTPFVGSPSAAQGIPLDDLTTSAVFATAPDQVQHALRLLDDRELWEQVCVTMEALTIRRYSAAIRAAAVGKALCAVGISAAEGQRWPDPLPLPPGPRGSSGPKPPLRPGFGWKPTDAEQLELESEPARYLRWCERYGPTAEALAGLADELQKITYRPTISIVMPVYNTDPDILREAVDSVQLQLYPGWQLCIADDGSTAVATLAVLKEIAGNRGVSMVRLAGNSGIAGATNAALELAKGDFVTFLDHDDLLKPHALAQVVRWLNSDPDLDLIYSDEDKLNANQAFVQPHLKPDWSPDLLMSNNYLCHMTVIRTDLVREIGGLRSEYDGSQDYDLFLRATERTDRIAHIAEPLYTWRIIPGSAAESAEAKPYAFVAGRRALADALKRRKINGQVTDTARHGIYRTSYRIPGRPRVSIIIPTKDRADLLRRCITSVLERSTYDNYEVVVIDNQTTDADTLGYLASLDAKILRYPHRFNYARMMNLGAAAVEADALLFLNNDTEVITPEWIENLLEHVMRPEVGAVGGRLFFGDGRPQHEGVLVGVGGWAYNVDHRGYWARGDMVRNVSAVTGACTMVRPSVYWRVGGNDERLRIAYNDVDLCLRIRQAGLHIVYTPYAELFHHESSTRSGWEHQDDGPLFGLRWRPREVVDPYYSPLFERHRPFVIAV